MSVEIAKQRILQRVPLAGLIGETVALTSRSGRQVGLCPFHGEKSPSFTIFDDHYFCFGCRARGDAISFVREIQGLSFFEALRYLAEKYGVEAPELDNRSNDRQQRQAEANLYKISAESLSFFQERLRAPSGAFALEYLIKRGFSEEFINKHQFGLSPAEPQTLVNHLLRKGFAIQDMIQSSVANSSQYDNRAYDFFTNRLMIPIFDQHGRVIAFGGRCFGDEQPKYKNSRETPLFDKSHVLYGLHVAKENIRRDRRAIVCEGYMDVLQLWAAGIPHAVACLGTALTIHHLRRLAALTPRVYLIFDGDRAGQAATLRTVSMALEVPQTEFKVVTLPPEHDPDTFVKSFGAEALEHKLQSAENLLEYAVQTRLQQTHDLGIPDLIQKEFVPWLQSIEDRVRRQYLLVRIAELTGIAAGELQSSLRPEPGRGAAPKKQAFEPPIPVKISAPLRALDRAEHAFIGHLYFSRPDELDLDGLEPFIQTQMELEEPWVELVGEMIKALRKKLVPSELNMAHWNALVVPELLQKVEILRTKEAELYITKDRRKDVQRIIHVFRERALKASRQQLRLKVSAGNLEDGLELAAAADRINNELLAVKKQLTPEG